MLRCRECGTRVPPSNPKFDGNLSARDHVRGVTLRSGEKTRQSQSVKESSPADQQGDDSLETSKKSETDRISATCGGCQRVVKAPTSLAGAEVRCPSCGHSVQIPVIPATDRKSDTVSQTTELSDQVLRRNLAEAIQRAIQKAEKSSIESPTSKDSVRKSKLAKLLKTVEKSIDAPRDYQLMKDAREAIQQIVDSGSQSAGETLVEWLPRIPEKRRAETIRAIGKLRVASGYESILRGLLSSNESDVEAAIRAAGNFGSPLSVKPLIFTQCLLPEQRIRISSSIAKIGESALPILFQILETSSESSVRLAAIHAIGEFNSPKAFDTLLKCIQQDQGALKIAAVQALVEIKDPKIIPATIKLASDSEPEIRKLAVAGLARMRGEKAIKTLVSVLKDSDRSVQLEAIEGLGDSKEKAVVSRLANFLESDDREIQLITVEAIAKLGEKRVLPKLLDILDKEIHDHAPSENTTRLVKALQRFRDPRSVLPLCQLLDSEDAKLRKRVVESLGVVGDAAARPALERILQRDSVDEVRAAAAKALGDLGDPAAVDALTTALNETSEVRIKALVSLARFKSANALPVIRQMLVDPLPQIRYQIANLLGEVGDQSAIPDLEQLAADDEPMVQRAALKSLETLGDDRSEAEIIKAYKKSKRARKTGAASGSFASSFSFGTMSSVSGGIATVLGAVAILLVMIGVGLAYSMSDGTSASAPVVRGYIDAIGVSADGSLLVAARNRGMTEVWDVKTSERIWFSGEIPRGKGVVVSQELKTVMVSSGKSAIFYDLDSSGTLSNPVEVPGHEKPIVQTTATTDRKFAATVDTAGVVRVWDMASRQTKLGLSIPDSATAIALETTGRILVAGGAGMGLQAWSLETTEVVFDSNKIGRIPTNRGAATSVAISPDAQLTAIALADGVIHVYDFDRERKLSQHEITKGRPMLAFNPENELIVVNRKLYRLADVSRGELEPVGAAVEARSTYNFSPVSNEMFLASDESSPVTIIDVTSGKSRKLDLEK